MLTYGLLGAIAIRSASASASSTPGAGRASSAPSKRTPSTSSRCACRRTTPGTGNSPAGVASQVRSRSSVAGSSAGASSERSRELAGDAESVSPARSFCVRTRCSPMSRSPSWNHVSPPSRPASSSAFQVSSGAAPAALLVEPPGERVKDRVEVGRDVERRASRCRRRRCRRSSAPPARSTPRARGRSGSRRAAGEDDDLHCARPVRSASSAAAVLGPSRPRAARDRRACRRRRQGSGSRPRPREPRAARRAPGSALRCRGRRAARTGAAPRARARSSSRRARRRAPGRPRAARRGARAGRAACAHGRSALTTRIGPGLDPPQRRL